MEFPRLVYATVFSLARTTSTSAGSTRSLVVFEPVTILPSISSRVMGVVGVEIAAGIGGARAGAWAGKRGTGRTAEVVIKLRVVFSDHLRL